MLKDIEIEKHSNFSLAVCRNEEEQELVYDIFLLNTTDEIIENVMVSCSGHGEIDGQQKSTTLMRIMVGDLPSFSFVKIESIIGDTIQLQNDFFVSGFSSNRLKDMVFKVVIPELKDGDIEIVQMIDKEGWIF